MVSGSDASFFVQGREVFETPARSSSFTGSVKAQMNEDSYKFRYVTPAMQELGPARRDWLTR